MAESVSSEETYPQERAHVDLAPTYGLKHCLAMHQAMHLRDSFLRALHLCTHRPINELLRGEQRNMNIYGLALNEVS